MANRVILNTRPSSHTKQTSDAFNAHGFYVIDFPCIEIIQSKNTKKCQKQIKNIDSKSTIIFTSPQAVVYFFKISPDWVIPNSSMVIAVGTKTAGFLEQHTNNNIFVPELQNSQGVIDLLQGLKSIQSIALISAKYGRQAIQNYAHDNSISLSQINVYKRQLPKVKRPLKWIKKDNLEIIVLVTSISILDNLKLLLKNSDWLRLRNQLLVCASERIESHAHQMGFTKTLNTMSANPTLMAEKLNLYLSRKA